MDHPRERYKAKYPGRPLPDWMEKLPAYVPLHEQTNAYWARIAPMPREVGVSGRPISQ